VTTQYLKRILPFTLTFIVGASLGGFSGIFKSRTAETERTTRTVFESRHGCAYKSHGYDRSPRARALSRTNIIATQSFPSDAAMYERGSEWRPVTILRSPAPTYPRRARHNGTQGVVRFSVIFGADGRTKIEEIVSTLPDGLTEEATEAVRAIEFTPATLSDEPVSTHGIVDSIFELADEKRP